MRLSLLQHNAQCISAIKPINNLQWLVVFFKNLIVPRQVSLVGYYIEQSVVDEGRRVYTNNTLPLDMESLEITILR